MNSAVQTEQSEMQLDTLQSMVQALPNINSEEFYILFDYCQPLIQASIKRCLHKNPLLKPYCEDINREALFVFRTLVEEYDVEVACFAYYLSKKLDYRLLASCQKIYLNQTSTGNGLNEMPLLDDSSNTEYDPFNAYAETAELYDYISSLDTKYQTAIDLYYFQGYNQEEGAKIMNYSQPHFNGLLREGLKQIKDLYKKNS